MRQKRIPATFYRGGTSKAVVFHARDLPQNPKDREALFLHVLGSPDPYKRQLNGMGGGLSSLSKALILEPSSRADADIDYTFVQVSVTDPDTDYGAMCGNMASAVGPWAVDEGIICVPDGEAVVRIYNTNTQKLFHARFQVADGCAVEEGSFMIPGVAQPGACVQIDALQPGGSKTNALLPTGRAIDTLSIPDIGDIQASLIDAANPVVFIRAKDMGKTGTEHPADLDTDTDFMTRMEAIRCTGARLMGLSDPHTGHIGAGVPKVAIVAPPNDFTGIDGQTHEADAFDIAIRLISMGNVHRALTLTGAMCVGAAIRVPGSLVNEVGHLDTHAPTRIGTPSGLLPVDAVMTEDGPQIDIVSATTYRTQRRLMEGAVLVPAI